MFVRYLKFMLRYISSEIDIVYVVFLDRRSWWVVIRRLIVYDIFVIYVCCYEDCYKIGLMGICLLIVILV